MSLQESIRKLTPVRKGDDVGKVASSDRINAIQDAIRSLSRGDNIVTRNIRRQIGSYNVALSTEPGVSRGGSGRGLFPWKIEMINRGTDESPDWNVHVYPGTINSIVPSNMFGEAPINNTGTYYVSLDCTTDGTSVTSAVINVNVSPPSAIDEDVGAAPDFFQLLLGMVVDLKVFQFIDYALFAFPVRTVYSLRGSPAPGEPYYDLHYTWKIGPSD